MAITIKTSLDDINALGDAIACEYTASSEVIGIFSNLGNVSKSLIPASSSATPNGSFNFIYVGDDANGMKLFVADRNIQHTISANTLSSAGISSAKAKVDLGAGSEYNTYIRLLTGGTSSSDTNCEWYSYIVSSTLDGKITAGASAVWNWNVTSKTWASNGSRVVRGSSTDINNWQTINPSYTTAGAYGFRPVMVVEQLNKIPKIPTINIGQTAFWADDIDNISLSATVTDGDGDDIQYKFTINGVDISDYSSLQTTPANISVSIAKSLFTDDSNSLILTVMDSNGAMSSFSYTIIKENQNVFTFGRKFDFSDEYILSGLTSIEYDNGLKLTGAGNGVLTTKYSMNTTGKANINNIVVTGGDDIITPTDYTYTMTDLGALGSGKQWEYTLDLSKYINHISY